MLTDNSRENSSVKTVLLILIVALSAALSSCATIPPVYVEPQTGPTATIQFKNETDGTNMGVARARGDMNGCQCSDLPIEYVGTFGNKGFLTPNYSKGADKGKNVDHFSIVAPADGSEFRAIMTVNGSTVTRDALVTISQVRICEAHVGFVPEAGKTYAVSYNFYREPCSFVVSEISGSLQRTIRYKKYPPCVYNKIPEDNGVDYRIGKLCEQHPELYSPKK